MSLNENLTTFTPLTKTYTLREQEMLGLVRQVVPKSFIKGCENGFDQDIRLLGMVALALQDFNTYAPCTNFTLNNFPKDKLNLLILGTSMYLDLFTQMRFTLIDISYSDGGLSVNLDRVGKININLTAMEKTWLRIVDQCKKCMLISFSAGLGTPRFQSNLSRFIGMLGNGAFGWNIP